MERARARVEREGAVVELATDGPCAVLAVARTRHRTRADTDAFAAALHAALVARAPGARLLVHSHEPDDGLALALFEEPRAAGWRRRPREAASERLRAEDMIAGYRAVAAQHPPPPPAGAARVDVCFASGRAVRWAGPVGGGP